MKLSQAQLEQIAWGAVRVEETEQGVSFYRFTKEQTELYRYSNYDFYLRSMAPAGVRLVFRTDSGSMKLTAVSEAVSTRTFISFDVFVNGKLLGCMDNFSEEEMTGDYSATPRPTGQISKTFELGEGEKTVMIQLPWSSIIVLQALELDEGAMFEPAERRAKTLLTYGDSITQGYDALRPSNRYDAQLADSLGAEEYCKAIGGEIFFPKLAELKDDLTPDYITIAYGTNDWGKVSAEMLRENCTAFLGSLTANYPAAKIFVITPIWRRDMFDYPERYDFMQVEEILASVAKGFSNVTVIRGYDFVTKDASFYADLRLHPNDKGFAEYHQNLWAAMQRSCADEGNRS